MGLRITAAGVLHKLFLPLVLALLLAVILGIRYREWVGYSIAVSSVLITLLCTMYPAAAGSITKIQDLCESRLESVELCFKEQTKAGLDWFLDNQYREIRENLFAGIGAFLLIAMLGAFSFSDFSKQMESVLGVKSDVWHSGLVFYFMYILARSLLDTLLASVPMRLASRKLEKEIGD